jgi:hypothetical protein
MNWLFKDKWRLSLWLTVVFCYTIILIRVCNVSMFDNSHARDFYHGDSYSDKNSYSTALYMYDFGMFKSKGLPVWHYQGDKDTANVYVYTHYPALPDFLTGVYSYIFNSKSEVMLRIIPVFVSMFFALAMYWILFFMIKNKQQAIIALIVMLLSNYFIFWADNLHKHQYEELFKWLFVGLLYWYYEQVEKRSFWIILLLALIYMVIANISFEPIVYLAIVTVGFSIIYDKSLLTKETIVLGVSSCIGFGLHLYQNYLFFGSWMDVVNDLMSAASTRTIGGGDLVANELGRTLNWLDFMNIPNLIQMRIERVFLFPGLLFFGLMVLVFMHLKKNNTKMYRILWVLLIASLSWSLVMTQHFTVHAFTIRQWGMLYALVIGFGLVLYKKWYLSILSKSKWGVLLHYIIILYACSMAITQHFYDYVRYVIFY